MNAWTKSIVLVSGMSAVALIGAQQSSRAEDKQIHRVVTTIDQSGKSKALFDNVVPLKLGGAGESVATIWLTEKAPSDFSWNSDRAPNRHGFAPGANGTHMLIVEFPPVGPEVDKLDVNTLMNVVGADAPKRGLPPSHPLMHRTRTVDYAIIMSGEIDMLLDTGPVHLRAGDVIVQQATNHAWLNRGKEPCRIAVVMMDAQEP